MSAESTNPSFEKYWRRYADWRQWASPMMIIGGVLFLVSLAFWPRQLLFSYLVAFMFFLSLSLGSLLLVMIHHLVDAGWSVPLRRVLEHLACLVPLLAVMFIPIAVFAPSLYSWMGMEHPDHSLLAKEGYLNSGFFYVRAVVYFAVWWWLAYSLRRESLAQDEDRTSRHTIKMRRFAAAGVILTALTLSGAAIDWVKSLQYHWFSTMYGVYIFAGSVLTALATLYLFALLLGWDGTLSTVLQRAQFHNLGVLLLAFTVFYAYIAFSQYFIIWNGAIPEETFWYVLREKGSWWDVGLLMIFGHFALPFLLLLRVDAKLTPALMIPLCFWFLLMRFMDLSFNIMPVLHPDGFVLHLADVACMLLFGGVVLWFFRRELERHPAYPINDPRLNEALNPHEEEASPIAAREVAK